MTTYASLPDGPRDVGPGDLHRLIGPHRGRDSARDPLPGRGGSTSATAHLGPVHDEARRGVRPRLAEWLWPVAYVTTSILTAALALALFIVAIVGVASLPALGAGVLLVVPAVWGAWVLGALERHRIAAFLGVDIGRRPPSTASRARVVTGMDESRLRAIGWTGLHALWGMLSSVLVITVLAQALVLLSLPVWGWRVDSLRLLGIGLFTIEPGATSVWVAGSVGLVILLLVPWMARGLASVDVAVARWLLGADPQAELRQMSERVETLTTARSETIDSVEAERRRIERDLHDGPQQRLVSIAMNLGLARDALDRDSADPADPGTARMVRDLLDEAHASSKDAITEMRHVARGIVPPILTDRGLDAAVSALADRSAVPVSVCSRLPDGRLDPTIEAIAYFSVSEALTNVAKHSDATCATVELGTARDLDGDLLALTISDDGRGGAVIGGGSGLTGLRQRVGAVDGQLHVHSPDGTGTTVSITMPLRPGGAR